MDRARRELVKCHRKSCKPARLGLALLIALACRKMSRKKTPPGSGYRRRERQQLEILNVWHYWRRLLAVARSRLQPLGLLAQLASELLRVFSRRLYFALNLGCSLEQDVHSLLFASVGTNVHLTSPIITTLPTRKTTSISSLRPSVGHKLERFRREPPK